ncbi:dihydrofolate reductase family protein [Lactovum miscens]|uniref:Dihydrofolate reductase n=1 Tax=Lactovum miscens TaxID=190387 RepID=A0A841C4Y5_9LACT|nr:dihydrofolate reductase family protein [Lactovum miscens]MBB5887404.1 dihydrofolate reductase [Lactovum miscens]
MTVKLYIAATLDGYIADRNESLDWLFEVSGKGDNGYGKFISQIDNLIMGRHTYEWMINEIQNITHEDWPYYGKSVYVLSRQTLPDNKYVKFVLPENLQKIVKELNGNIWNVGGGETIKLFLENHLIDELQVTVAPVLLGDGIPLFPKGNYFEKLELIETTTYGQFVELHYKVK